MGEGGCSEAALGLPRRGALGGTGESCVVTGATRGEADVATGAVLTRASAPVVIAADLLGLLVLGRGGCFGASRGDPDLFG